jgi:putative endopeptidase
MRTMRTFLTLGVALCLAPYASAQKAMGFDPSAIDRAADPCADFYQFACGGWMAANPIPSDQSRWGRFNELQERNREVLRKLAEAAAAQTAGRNALDQKIGDFYAACVDEKTINAKGISPLKPELDRIAGIRNKAEITDAVIRNYRSGAGAFFRFSSAPDAKNSTQMIADLDQGGLGLPDRDYYFKTDEKSVDLREKYVAHVQKMFELAGVKPEDAARQAKAVLEIETALAKGSLDRVSRRDPEKLYHIMTVAELSLLSPSFGWAKFFQGIGTPKFTKLNVDVPDFVRGMEAAISSASLDDLKAYLSWTVLHNAADVLAAPFEQETFNFFGKTLQGTKEMRARWKRCIDLTDNLMPDALGRRFVETTLGAEGMRRTQEMVGEIEKVMAADLQSLDWMTPKTKDQALTKLHGILNKIGTNEKWQSYATVRIARDDAYGNAERASEFEIRRQLAKIGKPVDKKEWQMSQPTVNAYYDPQQNNINFPAGILQPPFWDNALDDAVNYGAIGAVIGHELTHGFDDEGRQFDAKGNLRDWWSPEDAKAFEERADCFVQQYGSYTAIDDVKLNGKLTLGENTADNGGLRLAYMALMNRLAGKEPEKRDGFTAEQRFFLGWGQIWCENRTPEVARLRAQTDPHSPGRYRVNGVVSNMPEFQKAFACGTGAPMVRNPACRVW